MLLAVIVLFKLYTQRQPGGAAEKTKLLRLLVVSKNGRQCAGKVENFEVEPGMSFRVGSSGAGPFGVGGLVSKVSCQAAYKFNSRGSS